MNNEDKKVADAIRHSWVYWLPVKVWPYAQLARWERPIGWQLLMWPCWWGVMLAIEPRFASLAELGIDNPLLVMEMLTGAPWFLFLFFAGSFFMRGAGCTYNDLVDQDIDNQVARTRSRPLPSGRVSRTGAMVFLCIQLLLGLLVLLQFNRYTIIVGLISVITIVIYPFMKRITWWPQLFLGLAFSWGALVGWTSVFGQLAWSPIAMYLGCILWIIAYDTIYAHQDIEDDALVGVKSTARLFGENTTTAISVLYLGAWILFAASFWFAGAGIPAWIGLAGAGIHMVWQVRSLDIHDPAKCLKLFKSNNILGLIMFSGLAIFAVIGPA